MEMEFTRPAYPVVPLALTPLFSVICFGIGLFFAAWLFVVISSKKGTKKDAGLKTPKKTDAATTTATGAIKSNPIFAELLLASGASFFLGWGSLFLLLWTGVFL
ncbi:hypothetical protein Pelo_6663 [Pelomyxa schiedti]|nr:hypothetical protein Pelo_6663 [Pelomyxa schiedti]